LRGFFDKENIIEKEIKQKRKKIKPIILIPEYTKVIINDFNFLKTIKDGDIIVIDIETTGLKPHKEGHKIICISITKGNKTVVFNKYIDDLHNVLKNKNIKKIAHNLKFENCWIKIIFGYWVKGWYWDTMIYHHILDNTDRTGLKYLTEKYFNVIDYDINIKKYLKSENSNGFNSIEEADLNDIMIYCGYDTYFTNKLYELQKDNLDNHLKKGFDFFMQAQIHFSYVQNNGVCFDKEKYDLNNKNLKERLIKLNDSIQNNKNIKSLKLEEEFKFNSTKELRNLLFNVMKLKSIKDTATGFKSVDEETLSKLNNTLCKRILKHRYYAKIKDTYLNQFINEAAEVNDVYYIFPFFNLQSVKTYRSSSSNPNFQNIPKRDQFAKKITRECLIPRKNRRLLEIDFKGMEVSVGCCYHKDNMMISYVTNKENDMHRDVAASIFMKDRKEITKMERFCGKNGFVFPSFYGSTSRTYNGDLIERGYGDLTLNLWELLNDDMKSYLYDKNIKNIFSFQKHIEKIEEKFWGETFCDYQRWKFDNWKEYKEKGFIELYTGFRCVGKMSFNQVNNFRVQGTAFHVMLWCLIEINKYLIKNDKKSLIIGQIHDSILFDVVEEELEELKKVIKEICTVKVREHFKWIIVPLEIEAEITGINESWNLKKEIEI
jgi:DNA polymerase-1